MKKRTNYNTEIKTILKLFSDVIKAEKAKLKGYNSTSGDYLRIQHEFSKIMNAFTTLLIIEDEESEKK
jgi:hypothetical protein